MELDSWVGGAEQAALKLKNLFKWLLVVLFAFTIVVMLFQVFGNVLGGGELAPEEIIATLGTVMVLTIVVDGFNVVRQNTEEIDTIETVLKMAIVGAVANIFFGIRRLGDRGMPDYTYGFASLGLILGLSAAGYLVVKQTSD